MPKIEANDQFLVSQNKNLFKIDFKKVFLLFFVPFCAFFMIFIQGISFPKVNNLEKFVYS